MNIYEVDVLHADKHESLLQVDKVEFLMGYNTLAIYYTSNVLPPLTIFFGIHTNLILHVIVCVTKNSLLLFQVMVGPCKLTFLTLFRMGLFGAAHKWGGGAKRSPLSKICHISYNDETWHSYTLPKEDPKTV